MISSGFITRKVNNKRALLLCVCGAIILSLLVYLGCLHSYNKTVSFCGYFLVGLFLHSFWPMSSIILLKISQPVSEIYSFGFGQMLGSVQLITNGLIFAKVFQLDRTYWIPFTFSYLILAYSIAFISFSCIRIDETNDQIKAEEENNNNETKKL